MNEVDRSPSSLPLEPLPSSSRPSSRSPELERGLDYLARIQWERGCWVGEVVWCPMLIAQYVIVGHLTGQPIPREEQLKIRRYFEVWRTDDGGWGMHRESPAYVFMTTLVYIALRMMGAAPGDELAAGGLAWLRARPKDQGVKAIPSWGKFWLAMLNLYGWEGVNPIPPELWILPESLPIHPKLYYNHTRLIYLGIGYLYGRRFTAPLSPLIEELRRELYPDEDFGAIDWNAHRHEIASTDLYVKPHPILRAAYDALHAYERVHSKMLRSYALDRCFERILFEQRSTRYACVSPVNGLLNVLAIWDRDPDHPDFLPSWQGVDYWKWEDEEEGVRMNGAHSHTWDTAFTVQAILDGPGADHAAPALKKAYAYLDEAQMREEIPERERWFRDRRKGGFCFSDQHHQWPVSDCTAEALAALVRLRERGLSGIPDDRFVDAAEFLLTRQNPDGGWGSYERRRGNLLLEALNPSEMFGNCMTERSYLECTASCIVGLAEFRRAFPSVMTDEIARAIDLGVDYLIKVQPADGGWPGFWGVNYTYSIMYCIGGLRAAGLPASHPAIIRACDFLLAHQKADGGWGEHYTSCLENRYIEHPESQVIMTAWAVMALLRAEHPDRPAIARGVELLRQRQRADGSWPKEGVGGVFFNTAMHHYCLYKDYFSIWALGLWEKSAVSCQLSAVSSG